MTKRYAIVELSSCHNCPHFKSLVGPNYCWKLKEFTGGQIPNECPLPEKLLDYSGL